MGPMPVSRQDNTCISRKSTKWDKLSRRALTRFQVEVELKGQSLPSEGVGSRPTQESARGDRHIRSDRTKQANARPTLARQAGPPPSAPENARRSPHSIPHIAKKRQPSAGQIQGAAADRRSTVSRRCSV